MYYRFEKLEVWQLSRQFAHEIYAVTKLFPKDELFSLTNQTRRAETSVMLNIAEGCDRGSDLDYARYLKIAHTSLTEVVAALYIALDEHYLALNRFQTLYETSHILDRKLVALIRSLRT